MPKVAFNPKIHYTLNQASKITGLEVYVIRYWNAEELIELKTNRAGRKFCTHSDIKKILFVKKCLREDRLTIAGTLPLAKAWKEIEASQSELEFK
ncbi:MAG: MerR family transcriptional regulator [Candidatus Omnitrophica bacterium]|nr:MerR family transcriptional regulator [Candidatus Omnitrophota bacterium]